MTSLLLPLHIVAAGLWLGCVLTEALFERALLGQGPAHELILVRLHQRVDQIVEIPAFLAVLVTGGLMLAQAPLSALLAVKVGLGLTAVAANVWCVRLVFLRATAAERGEREAFARLDHAQHRYGAVVLLTMIGALVLGLFAAG
jgi:hypothetical protein